MLKPQKTDLIEIEEIVNLENSGDCRRLIKIIRSNNVIDRNSVVVFTECHQRLSVTLLSSPIILSSLNLFARLRDLVCSVYF